MGSSFEGLKGFVDIMGRGFAVVRSVANFVEVHEERGREKRCEQ